MMYTIRRSCAIAVLFGVLLPTIHASLTDRLLEIFKGFIQSNCNCSPYNCCSKWGYCGLTNGYCGEGCQSGPCKTRLTRSHSNFTITSELFQCVFPTIDTNLRTRRLQGLSEAMREMKWQPINTVEAAIFLTHISYETDGLKTLSESCVEQKTCNNYQLSWCSIPIHPDLKYYGRGMLKLSYPCNYYNAGNALGLDLLNNPDLVHQSDKIAAATAIWYYKETGMNEFAQQGDFAGTTQRLNKSQCSNNVVQMARVRIYHKVRHCLGLPKTTVNLIC